MSRLRTTAAVAAPFAVAGLLVAATPATASAADGVERSKRGVCTNGSTWELELEREHGRIDVSFDADTNRAGKAWKVKVKQNGSVVHKGTYQSQRDGDVEVDRNLRDTAGTDTIIVRAKSKATGEICRAVLKI